MAELYSFRSKIKEILLFTNIAKQIEIDDIIVNNINSIKSENKEKLEFSNIEIQSSFNKVAFLLLTSKFENFIEGFLEKYAEIKITKNTFSDDNNEELLNQIINNILNKIEKLKPQKNFKQSDINDYLKEITNIIEKKSDINISEYNKYFDSKFNYGKHGSDELIKLLKKFGFKEFVNNQVVFFQIFNSIIGIRNNIIHQDKTPSLSNEQMENYINKFCQFSDDINEEANKMLQ